MKRFFLTLAAILTLGSLASAEEWLTDYAKALAQAKTQNRPVLIDFTGSTWCPACIMMERNVFSLETFKSYAAQKLVLLKIDFPQGTPSAQQVQLANKYKVDGFPTMIILNPDGTKAGEFSGYLPGGPKAFIAELEKVTPKK